MIFDVFSLMALATTFGLGIYMGYRYAAESRKVDALVAHALDNVSHRPKEWDDEEWWAAK